eukprot:gene2465-3047_t
MQQPQQQQQQQQIPQSSSQQQQQQQQQSKQPQATHSLTSQQQNYLLEQYDELKRHIGLIRSNVNEFFGSFIEDIRNNQTTINKEEMSKRLKQSFEQNMQSIAKIDQIAQKITSYSHPVQTSNFSPFEQNWAISTGIYDQQNIKGHFQLRKENYWRYETSKKSNLASQILEKKLEKQFPNLIQQASADDISKKRKQQALTPTSSSSSSTTATTNNTTSPILSSQTTPPLFKQPSLPPISSTSDYFINIERIIQSVRQESALEIHKIQKNQSSLLPKGLYVECPDVFKCLISLGISSEDSNCFCIDRITLFGFKESFDSFWISSKYNIFKKISENAYEAIGFYSANAGNSVLKNILLWLWSFRGLFVEECKGCNNILQLDSSMYMYLPPSLRTFDGNYTPYHPICYRNIHQSSSSSSTSTTGGTSSCGGGGQNQC